MAQAAPALYWAWENENVKLADYVDVTLVCEDEDWLLTVTQPAAWEKSLVQLISQQFS